MAIQSVNQFYQAVSNGKTSRFEWQKSTASSFGYTAGRMYDMALMTGTPVATTYPGTSLVAQTYHELTGDGTNTFGMYNGGVVSPDVKHLLNLGLTGHSSTAVPATVRIVDYLMGYSINANSNSLQTLINSNTVTASSSSGLLLTYTDDFTTYTQVRFTSSGTLPTGLTAGTNYWLVRVSATTARVATSITNAIAGTVIAYTDAGTGTHTMNVQIPRYEDGKGVGAFVVAKTTTGGSGHNLSYTYTNQDGTGSRVNPVTISCNTGAGITTIIHSGTGLNNYGPFLPYASTDYGIRKMDSVQFSAASGSGTAQVVLARVLANITVSVTSLATLQDLVNQVPSLPILKEGACIGGILMVGANTSASSLYNGHIEAIWG
jgi:hypothetical protein